MRHDDSMHCAPRRLLYAWHIARLLAARRLARHALKQQTYAHRGLNNALWARLSLHCARISAASTRYRVGAQAISLSMLGIRSALCRLSTACGATCLYLHQHPLPRLLLASLYAQNAQARRRHAGAQQNNMTVCRISVEQGL